jgi:glutathione S-transferase
MHLRLVSSELCPFVQRVRLVLEEKMVNHELALIDLEDRPAWFEAVSPRGKVPVLEVDGVAVYESHAICELLDELVPEPRLMPATPLARARDRALFAMASEDFFGPMHALMLAPDAAGVDRARARLEERLDHLERELAGRSYLSGEGAAFGMADVGFAPFLVRADLLREQGLLDFFLRRPAVERWAEALVLRPSVQRMLPPDHGAKLHALQVRRGAWILGQDGLVPRGHA